MRERCITNFDVYARMLLYDPDTGAYKEIASDELPAAIKRVLGFYVNVDAVVVGVYCSPTGPVCFHHQHRYPLVLGAWDATVTSDDEYDITQGQNTFTLFHDGHRAFTIAYHTTSMRYYDAWSACDADVDFFLWLKGKVDNERFHTVYTQEWSIGADDLLSPTWKP